MIWNMKIAWKTTSRLMRRYLRILGEDLIARSCQCRWSRKLSWTTLSQILKKCSRRKLILKPNFLLSTLVQRTNKYRENQCTLESWSKKESKRISNQLWLKRPENKRLLISSRGKTIAICPTRSARSTGTKKTSMEASVLQESMTQIMIFSKSR